MMAIFVRHKAFVSLLAIGSLLACGSPEETQSDLKIRGGQEVSNNDQTMVRLATVALTTDYTNSPNSESILQQGKSFCSGTIVDTRVVVTAAHCLQELIGRDQKGGPILPSPEDFIVHFDNRVSAEGNFARAAQVIPHPDWDPAATLSPFPGSRPNDIGVIILSQDIPSFKKAATIASPDLPVNGQTTYLAGFGVTRDRNFNDTGILRTVASKFSAENGSIARVSHGAFFQGICAGDSGGPAYVQVDGEMQLVGAASTGAEIPGLGCLGSNSNSTDVRYYSDWIEAVSNQ